jgi:hypothetical protein
MIAHAIRNACAHDWVVRSDAEALSFAEERFATDELGHHALLLVLGQRSKGARLLGADRIGDGPRIDDDLAIARLCGRERPDDEPDAEELEKAAPPDASQRSLEVLISHGRIIDRSRDFGVTDSRAPGRSRVSDFRRW